MINLSKSYSARNSSETFTSIVLFLSHLTYNWVRIFWLNVWFIKIRTLHKLSLCFCDFIMTFLANPYFIFQIFHSKTFKMKNSRCPYNDIIQKYSQSHKDKLSVVRIFMNQTLLSFPQFLIKTLSYFSISLPNSINFFVPVLSDTTFKIKVYLIFLITFYT